ncbi:hypothetical protein NEOCIP111885_04284 [Pseudoneobacillus rhizosphaerae]|uniref:DUF1648 domain-containing protein n=1 Tax=Pseudoneobacillus rhizosphaerae TaxID=2880968 RepID=A0A9C7GDT6_9BACI|nr:hypothetical protein NEOCIP111885_04284 [Pseudoneobacillus rhizosphaerae]
MRKESNAWKRPDIKLSKTKSEWAWNIIGYSFYLGSVIFLITIWNRLPKDVPAHYNALGEVDRWGSKWELLILPFVGAFIIVLMEALEKYPAVHNYPQRFNESNAEKFYLLSRKLVNQLKNICLIIIAVILYESVSIALGWGHGFGKWILPITILGSGFPIVLEIINQKKIK